jgi:hypothetical protein
MNVEKELQRATKKLEKLLLEKKQKKQNKQKKQKKQGRK